jgi:hypothetical protein
VKMTRQLLLDVGVCGTYVRTFSNKFPIETYPDGVELNREVCEAHANDFDWPWAVAEFLNWNGRQRWEDLVGSRSSEARAFGTGAVKKAALFGHIFDTMPELRNERVVNLARTSEERADERALEDVRTARRDLGEAKRQLTYWTDMVPRRERELAQAEAATADVTRRQAARAATAAAERVARLQADLEAARTAAEAAAAALAKLPEPEPEPTPEPAPAEATPADAQPAPTDATGEPEPARVRAAGVTS